MDWKTGKLVCHSR